MEWEVKRIINLVQQDVRVLLFRRLKIDISASVQSTGQYPNKSLFLSHFSKFAESTAGKEVRFSDTELRHC